MEIPELTFFPLEDYTEMSINFNTKKASEYVQSLTTYHYVIKELLETI